MKLIMQIIKKLRMAKQTPVSFQVMEQNLMKLKSYRIDGILGEGSFGKVYSGTQISDSRPLAFKVIPNFQGRMDPHCPSLALEVSFLMRLSHIPGVIQIVDTCWAGTTLIIVMERLESCMDLHDFIDQGRLTPELTRAFFSQLVETVIQCHAAGVVHRDIKPENILVDLRTNTVKLIDFGCGSFYRKFFTTQRGTPRCKPPEVFRSVKWSAECEEVWSLGVLLYRMSTREYPFTTKEELKNPDINSKTFPELVPVMCQDLIRCLLNDKWEERPKLEEIPTHPYLLYRPSSFSPVRLSQCVDLPHHPPILENGNLLCET